MLANPGYNNIPFIYRLPESLNKNDVKKRIEEKNIPFTETTFQNHSAIEIFLQQINARVIIVPDEEPMVVIWSNGDIKTANKAYEIIKGLLYPVITLQQPAKSIAFLFTDKYYLTEKSRMENILLKLFLGNPIAMVGILIIIATIGFYFLGYYLPIVLVLGQYIILLFSDKIMLKISDYKITEDDRHAHIVECWITDNEYAKSINIISKNKAQIKKEIYEQTIKMNNSVDALTVTSILNKYGINVLNVKITSIDIYKLVDEVRKNFRISIPRITLINTTISNAAATGISKKYATIAITIGLLMTLKENEIKAVIAHEFSHIVNHDPIVVSTLFSIEYTVRIFITLNLPIILAYLYLMFSFTTVFFIAKFFEERADLMGAFYTNSADSLTEALKRIGYRRLKYEQDYSTRAYSWLKWFDAHPPISYRIERLSKKISEKDLSITNIARECFSDLLRSIKLMLG
ncbi:MAG: M48 family metalloprotease [Thermoprotei archaeon]